MMPALKVAIIADDLTGAMDTAGPFAAAGLKTRVRFNADCVAANLPGDLDVLACTTQTRHLSADVAAARVADVVRALAGAAPKLLLKKIDTTLRGHVAAELAAALRTCGRRHLLVAPAAPTQGRTMRGGEVFVHRVPLRQSNAAGDALSPAASLPLAELLLQNVAGIHAHVLTRDAPLKLAGDSGPHAYPADAETDSDLDRIAAFALRYCDDILLAGATGIGAALAHSLAECRDVPACPEISPKASTGRVLFVVGSRTAVTTEQLARLRAADAEEIVVPVEHLSRVPAAAGAQFRKPVSLILRPQAGGRGRSDEVARILAQMAVALMHSLEVRGLVLTGGDTAAAVFDALGIRECVLVGEIMPGIPIGRLAGRHRSMLVVTKSGGYGDRDALVRIAERLHAASPA